MLFFFAFPRFVTVSTALVLAEVGSPLLDAELEAARRELGVTELVVELGEDGLRSDHPAAHR